MSDTAPEDRLRAGLPPEVAARLDRTRPLPPGRSGVRARARDLDPQELRRIEQAVAGLSASTRRNVLADWARWVAWCELNNATRLPAAALDVAAYLASALATSASPERDSYSPSTLRRWLHSLAAVHQAEGASDPTADPLVSAVIDAVPAHRTQGKPTRPLQADTVQQLLRALPADEWPTLPVRRRDRLIITLGFAAALSPADLVGLDTSELRIRSKDSALLAQTPRGETAITPATDDLSCLTCAYIQWRDLIDLADTDGLHAVRATYQSAHTPEGQHSSHAAQALPPELLVAERSGRPLLRRIRRGGTVTDGRLTPQVVTTQLRAYAEVAGLDPRTVSGLSLKAGGRIHRLLSE